MIEVVLILSGLVAAAVQLQRDKRPRTTARVFELLVLYQLVLPVGVGSTTAALLHMFAPDQTARSIGWATGSPFQYENAFGDLGYGVLGILCIWMRGKFWDATVIMSSISLIGDGFLHIYELVVHNNHAVNNAGPILYTDTLGPLLLIALFVAYRLAMHESPGLRSTGMQRPSMQ